MTQRQTELPEAVLRELREFLARGRSGQVLLSVKQGRIDGLQLIEKAKLDANGRICQDID